MGLFIHLRVPLTHKATEVKESYGGLSGLMGNFGHMANEHEPETLLDAKRHSGKRTFVRASRIDY